MLLKYEVTLRASRLDPRVVVAVQEPLVDQPVIHLLDIDKDDGTFLSIGPRTFFDCRAEMLLRSRHFDIPRSYRPEDIF